MCIVALAFCQDDGQSSKSIWTKEESEQMWIVNIGWKNNRGKMRRREKDRRQINKTFKAFEIAVCVGVCIWICVNVNVFVFYNQWECNDVNK